MSKSFSMRTCVVLVVMTCTCYPGVVVANKDSKGHKSQKSSGKEVAAVISRENFCSRLDKALRRRDTLKTKINNAIDDFRRGNKQQKSATNKHKIINEEIDFLSVFRNELSFNEEQIFHSIKWFEICSKNVNFKNYTELSKCIELRLNSLRDSTFHVEEQYQSMKDIEEKIVKHRNHTHSDDSILSRVLDQLSDAADELEDELGGNDFNDDSIQRLKARGSNLETVVRTSSKLDSIIRLLDAQDNQYVLSKPADNTMSTEDEVLLMEIVYITVCSTVFSYLCNFLYLPSMFGQLMAGLFLGPSALNVLTSLVQIETLGEFGVFFIMFSVGLEFSFERLRRVLYIAVTGAWGLTGVMILAGVLFSLMFPFTSQSESCFIAACLSLSSTPLVIKLTSFQCSDKTSLDGSHQSTHGGIELQEILLGVLIMQDVCMCLLIALLPTLAGASTENLFSLLVSVIGALFVVILFSVLLFFILRRLQNKFVASLSPELKCLTSASLAFILLWLTRYLGISMELGCFIAGSIVSTIGHPLSTSIDNLISPLRDYFSLLFFSSIGLHIFPSFVLLEMGLLALSTVTVIIFKFGISVILMRCCLPHSSRKLTWLIAAGLSQVSEFSFVLSSRARHLGLLSREVYLTVLSLSTLSLMVAPILWNIVSWSERERKRTTPSRQTSCSDDYSFNIPTSPSPNSVFE